MTRQGAFLSDEPTMELIIKAQGGDHEARLAILERAVPSVRQWAHGRLPPGARGPFDTEDLVQGAVLHVLQRLEFFEPRHVGAMQAYLRRSIINAIRDRLRHVAPRQMIELPEDLINTESSPLDDAITGQSYERYRAALATLRPLDRELIVARIEAEWTPRQLADGFGYRSEDAARVAATRAIRRLRTVLEGTLDTAAAGHD